MYPFIFVRTTEESDPRKSKCLFEVHCGEPDDPNLIVNRLYENEKGEFFFGSIVGYTVVSADCGIGEEKIMPLTEEEAKEWVRIWFYYGSDSDSYRDFGALKKFGYGQKDSKGSCKE